MARVLVVDDEQGIRQLLERFVRRHGHEVVQAESADAALAAMASQPADVAFLDIQMPGHDGRWLTLEMRKRYPATAIVLATGVNDLEANMTLQFGVLSYLLKPFNADAVARALGLAVEWHTQNAGRTSLADDGASLERWLNSLDLS